MIGLIGPAVETMPDRDPPRAIREVTLARHRRQAPGMDSAEGWARTCDRVAEGSRRTP
jgi:hypothetical protein